jgi:Cu+-exporting ATPase
MSKIMDTQNCFHCGLDVIKAEEIIFDDKNFVATVANHFQRQ